MSALGGEAWTALGAAVVHFLWQGTLVGLVAAATLRGLRREAPAARASVAFAALAACLLAFASTFAVELLARPAGAAAGLSGLAASGSGVEELLAPRARELAARGWALGVLVLALRALLRLRGARRLCTTAVSAPPARWQRAFLTLQAELGLRRPVRLLASGLAEVPMVVGWLAPIVLVPLSAFTLLGPAELRALLAHELSHVRRHDHVLNAVQAAVEVVLFFHPVVWWLSRELRAEREYACDDTAVRLMGDARPLAEALLALESFRIDGNPSHAALAADGGPLMQRIRRIVQARPEARTSTSFRSLPSGLALLGLLTLAGTAFAARAPQEGGGGSRVHVRQQAEAERAAVEKQEREARRQEAAQGGKVAPRSDEVEPAELAELRASVEAAVEAGTLTPEEGKRRIALHLQQIEEQHEVQLHERLEQAAAKIRTEVEAGRLTPAEGKAKLAALHAELVRGLHEKARIDPEQAVREIQAAVKAGKLTPAEGAAKIEALRLEEAARTPRSAEEEIRRIEEAVRAGTITPEEARARVAAVKARLAELSRRTKERQALVERVQAAVRAGKITKEEAARKLEAVKRAHEQDLHEVHELHERGEAGRARGTGEVHEVHAEHGAGGTAGGGVR